MKMRRNREISIHTSGALLFMTVFVISTITGEVSLLSPARSTGTAAFASDRVLSPKTSKGISVVMPTDIHTYARLTSDFRDKYNPNGTLRIEKGVLKLHNAVDWNAPYRTEIISADEGDVLKTAEQSKTGRYVAVALGFTDKKGEYRRLRISGQFVISGYRHLDEIFVKEGQRVKIGVTKIGTVGNSGTRNPAHLHKEYHLGIRIGQSGSGYEALYGVLNAQGLAPPLNPWDLMYNPDQTNPVVVPILLGPEDATKYAPAAEQGRWVFPFYGKKQ